MNNISNQITLINYTIASEAYEMCKLFLTMYSHKQLYAYEVFYVKLLSCPVGFTLQNGVCHCDPTLTNYIDKCYIDYSAIRRPANTWITSHTQTNNTNYMISDCPMDYCLPHSFNINLRTSYILINSVSLRELESCALNVNNLLAWYLGQDV